MYQQAQPLVSAVMGGPNMPVDARRNPKYLPGQLVHTVIVDQQALECHYCFATCPCCCEKETLAKATYMDIYTNGVEIGQPSRETSIGVFHHFDDFVVFNEPAFKGERCGPFPFCYVNWCDFCGEALVMKGRCHSGTSHFALGNECSTLTWIPCIACCFPMSIMYGLAPGEANRACEILNTAMSQYKSGNWPKEPRVAMAMNPAPTAVMMLTMPYLQPPVQQYQPSQQEPHPTAPYLPPPVQQYQQQQEPQCPTQELYA